MSSPLHCVERGNTRRKLPPLHWVERGLGGEVNQGENQTCPPLSHAVGRGEVKCHWSN